MRALITVFLKELLENARDRRTLLSALLVGPIGAPLLFTLMINVTLHRSVDNAEQPLKLAIAGAENAPNLVGFLKSHNVEVSEFAGDVAAAAAAVRAHERKLVLVIPPEFGTRLGAGRPAPVQLYIDSSDTSAGADRNRAAGLLGHYSAEIVRWRLQTRGLAPTLLQAIAVDEVDVSTAAGRAVALLGMLSYFFVFAALMGGVYVAIDATAGERERGSLEPLLTLPVERRSLVLGKILAASAWMLVSLALTVTAFAISLRFVRLEAFGMSTNFGPRVGLSIIALMLPFLLLGASLMTLVASFTRSYREAQSWLTFVLLVPTVPIMYAAISQLQSKLALMWIPSLSQHLLISSLLKAEPLAGVDVAVSAGATLVLGGVIAAAAVRLYRREQILG